MQLKTYEEVIGPKIPWLGLLKLGVIANSLLGLLKSRFIADFCWRSQQVGRQNLLGLSG